MPTKIAHIKVVVIGSGFSGLSCACHLAKAGYEVTLLEKTTNLGEGPESMKKKDLHGTWGRRGTGCLMCLHNSFIHLERRLRITIPLSGWIPPIGSSSKMMYGIFLPRWRRWKSFSKKPSRGAAKNRDLFLLNRSIKYDLGIKKLAYKPGRSILEYVDAKLLLGLFKLDVFTSIAKHVRKHFKDDRLIQWMEFPILFLGATAENTPAFYTLMNYADMSLGTWHPKGGMNSVVKGLVSLTEELGVDIRYNEEVTSFSFNEKRIHAVNTQGPLFKKEDGESFGFLYALKKYEHQ